MNELFEGIKPRTAVDIVRTRFPKFDKTLYSKAMYPDRYGIVLHPAADEMLRAALSATGDAEKRHKSGKHLLTREIRCRLPDADIDALKAAIADDGYTTVQDWMSATVHGYLRKERDSDVVI